MGDLADDVLSGLMCEGCGDLMPDNKSPGYPRKCQECIREEHRAIGRQIAAEQARSTNRGYGDWKRHNAKRRWKGKPRGNSTREFPL